MSTQLTEVQAQLLPVLKKHRIQKAIVFGSIARGDASPRSDLDLLLVQQTDKRFFDRYDGLLYEIGSAIVPHRELDVLIYTPQELENIAHRQFIATILSEGKVIYESE
jgi:uncharacterized protein